MNTLDQLDIPSEKSEDDLESLLAGESLTVVSNRGPVDFSLAEDGSLQMQKSAGGLVTALLGLAQSSEITWIASAVNELEKSWGNGKISFGVDGNHKVDFNLQLVPLDTDIYNGYYNVISNPLLWFLQHSMWNFASSPMITRDTWQAWEHGYKVVNQIFADTISRQLRSIDGHSLVMVQDYHLYLLPRYLRDRLRRIHQVERVKLTHFVHIPWPGPEDIRILPAGMRHDILEGLAAADLVGFQTHEDVLNFLLSVESHLPGAYINYRRGRIWYRNHATQVRDFPISIDVKAIKELAQSTEARDYREQLENIVQDKQIILRVDRTEPSKNIVRGFQAFGEMLELHPEHCGKVQFLALLVPSRLDVDEYRTYHDEIMAAAGWVNSRYGSSEWEPIRIFLGDNYTRAIAALQIFDVLLVNSVADGMNLVAKEGALINQKNGVLVLSERTGARQQLEPGALVISPCDVYGTAEALHQALVMPNNERQTRASRLRWLVEENDINQWLRDQLREVQNLRVRNQISR